MSAKNRQSTETHRQLVAWFDLLPAGLGSAHAHAVCAQNGFEGGGGRHCRGRGLYSAAVLHEDSAGPACLRPAAKLDPRNLGQSDAVFRLVPKPPQPRSINPAPMDRVSDHGPKQGQRETAPADPDPDRSVTVCCNCQKRCGCRKPYQRGRSAARQTVFKRIFHAGSVRSNRGEGMTHYAPRIRPTISVVSRLSPGVAAIRWSAS